MQYEDHDNLDDAPEKAPLATKGQEDAKPQSDGTSTSDSTPIRVSCLGLSAGQTVSRGLTLHDPSGCVLNSHGGWPWTQVYLTSKFDSLDTTALLTDRVVVAGSSAQVKGAPLLDFRGHSLEVDDKSGGT